MNTEWVRPNRLPVKEPDFKWVLAAQAGYVVAFEELVARNESRIYRLALNTTQDWQDTEDVLQTTFVKAYEHLGEFRGNCRFSVWVLRIGAREALGKLREKHPDEFAFDQSAETEDSLMPKVPEEWTDDPRKRFSQNDLKQILSEGINVLKPTNRIVFLLRDVEKCSSQEVADVLGLSVPEVKSRLLRARLEMRSHLNRYFRRENDSVPNRTTRAKEKQKRADNERTVSSTAA